MVKLNRRKRVAKVTKKRIFGKLATLPMQAYLYFNRKDNREARKVNKLFSNEFSLEFS